MALDVGITFGGYTINGSSDDCHLNDVPKMYINGNFQSSTYSVYAGCVATITIFNCPAGTLTMELYSDVLGVDLENSPSNSVEIPDGNGGHNPAFGDGNPGFVTPNFESAVVYGCTDDTMINVFGQGYVTNINGGTGPSYKYCNYNPLATVDDGSCIMPEAYENNDFTMGKVCGCEPLDALDGRLPTFSCLVEELGENFRTGACGDSYLRTCCNSGNCDDDTDGGCRSYGIWEDNLESESTDCTPDFACESVFQGEGHPKTGVDGYFYYGCDDGDCLDHCGSCDTTAAGGFPDSYDAATWSGNYFTLNNDGTTVCGHSAGVAIDVDCYLTNGSCSCVTSADFDCAGTCGGESIVGEDTQGNNCGCGIESSIFDLSGCCNGVGIACVGSGYDCLAGDNTPADECGECGGDGINDPYCDCENNVNDQCGECGMNGVGVTCTGNCYDGAMIDDCGICDPMNCGDNGNEPCGRWYPDGCTGADCLLVEAGTPTNNCDCAGNTFDCTVTTAVTQNDFDTSCSGNVQIDQCGECGGSNLTDCVDDGGSCNYDTDCISLSCDACGICCNNIDFVCHTACGQPGDACGGNNECESYDCDVCGCDTGIPDCQLKALINGVVTDDPDQYAITDCCDCDGTPPTKFCFDGDDDGVGCQNCTDPGTLPRYDCCHSGCYLNDFDQLTPNADFVPSCQDVDDTCYCPSNIFDDYVFEVSNGTCLDMCGVCFGEGGDPVGIVDGTCDCAGNVDDCSGTCNGEKLLYTCGSGPGELGDAYGDATLEMCGGYTDVCALSATAAGCFKVPDDACDCEGNVNDCAGECNGDAVIDECGICNGDGIAVGECDCDGNVLDCNDECGGDAVVDECGVCNGPGKSRYYFDEDQDTIPCCGQAVLELCPSEVTPEHVEASGLYLTPELYNENCESSEDPDVCICNGSYDPCGSCCNGGAWQVINDEWSCTQGGIVTISGLFNFYDYLPDDITTYTCSQVSCTTGDGSPPYWITVTDAFFTEIFIDETGAEQDSLPSADACGVCNGDNSSCADCTGSANGTNITDCNDDCIPVNDWITSIGDGVCDGRFACYDVVVQYQGHQYSNWDSVMNTSVSQGTGDSIKFNCDGGDCVGCDDVCESEPAVFDECGNCDGGGQLNCGDLDTDEAGSYCGDGIMYCTGADLDATCNIRDCKGICDGNATLETCCDGVQRCIDPDYDMPCAELVVCGCMDVTACPGDVSTGYYNPGNNYPCNDYTNNCCLYVSDVCEAAYALNNLWHGTYDADNDGVLAYGECCSCDTLRRIDCNGDCSTPPLISGEFGDLSGSGIIDGGETGVWASQWYSDPDNDGNGSGDAYPGYHCPGFLEENQGGFWSDNNSDLNEHCNDLIKWTPDTILDQND